MGNKTVIVILTIAAALAAFIFLFERNSLTTSERQERKNRAFAEYKKERVDKITLNHISGSTVSLEKVSSKDNPEGRWQIVKPRALNANDVEVESLLSALDYLLCDRSVKGVDNLKDPRFGITAPRIEGTFSMLGKTTTFKIGSDAEGDKVYLYTDQTPDTIFAVNKDILESLDKSADDLRNKQLVPSDLENTTGIEVKRSIGELSLSKPEAKDWQVTVGENKILAAADQVKELIGAVGDLRAEKFVADDVKEPALAQYGLAAPSVEIRVMQKDGKSVDVRMGDSCKDNTNLRYATVVSSGTVACIKDELSSIAERPLMRFEETRPVTLDKEEIKNIHLVSGDKSLTLEKGESEWKISGVNIKADDDTMTAFLKALTETRAKQIVTDSAALSVLTKPSGSVVITSADNQRVTLDLFGKEADLLKIQRAGEPALLQVPPDMESMLVADPLVFRSKTIVQGEADTVDRIEVTGQSPQTLEKKDGTWQISKPLSAAADMTAVRNLTELVAKIKVTRFVSPSARKEHGFDHPFAVVTAHFSKDSGNDTDTDAVKGEATKTPTTSILEIGNTDADGRRYARLRGTEETVFVVENAFEYALEKPLIARDLLQIEETDLTRLTFKTPEQERSFTKSDESGWTADNGGPTDADTLGKIVADLGGLKASGAESFGRPETSFAIPQLVITAEFKGDKPSRKVITISKRSDEKSRDAYLARTNGLDVTFSISARIVDDILKFLSPTQAAPTELHPPN
jgi:hypothetical protein